MKGWSRAGSCRLRRRPGRSRSGDGQDCAFKECDSAGETSVRETDSRVPGLIANCDAGASADASVVAALTTGLRPIPARATVAAFAVGRAFRKRSSVLALYIPRCW